MIKYIGILEKKYEKVLKDNVENNNVVLEKLKDTLKGIKDEILSKKEELSLLNDNKAILKNDIIYYEYLQDELRNKANLILEYSDELVYKMIRKL